MIEFTIFYKIAEFNITLTFIFLNPNKMTDHFL